MELASEKMSISSCEESKSSSDVEKDYDKSTSSSESQSRKKRLKLQAQEEEEDISDVEKIDDEEYGEEGSRAGFGGGSGGDSPFYGYSGTIVEDDFADISETYGVRIVGCLPDTENEVYDDPGFESDVDIAETAQFFEAPYFLRDPEWASIHPLHFDQVHGELKKELEEYCQETIKRYNKAKGALLRLKYVVKATEDLDGYHITAALIDDGTSETYVGRLNVILNFPPLPPVYVSKMRVTKGKYVVPTWKEPCRVNEEYRRRLPALEMMWVESEKKRAENADGEVADDPNQSGLAARTINMM